MGAGTTAMTPYFVMYSETAMPVVATPSIMNMPFGRQYALIQKHHNHPIKLKTPLYFKDREMVRLTKLAPPPPLPIAVYNQRNAEDKLPPPEDMSVEPEYMQKKVGDEQ